MTNALPDDATRIVVEEIFPHAPETIWRTLTTGALMSRWLGMATTDFQPIPGTSFTYRTTPAGAWDGTIHCDVLEAIPNQRLAYSWRGGDAANTGYGAPLDTTVTFTLEAVPGGTRLRLVHAGFVLPRNETARRGMGAGWVQAIARIGALSTGQAGPN